MSTRSIVYFLPLYFPTHAHENNLFQRTSLFSPSSEQRKSLQTDDPVQGGWHYLRLSCRANHPFESRGESRGLRLYDNGLVHDLTLHGEMYMRARMNISPVESAGWGEGERKGLEIKTL